MALKTPCQAQPGSPMQKLLSGSRNRGSGVRSGSRWCGSGPAGPRSVHLGGMVSRHVHLGQRILQAPTTWTDSPIVLLGVGHDHHAPKWVAAIWDLFIVAEDQFPRVYIRRQVSVYMHSDILRVSPRIPLYEYVRVSRILVPPSMTRARVE